MNNRLNLFYIHIIFILTQLHYLLWMPCAMSLPILYYSALISLFSSFLSYCAFFDFRLLSLSTKTCLLALLYYKDCTTTRQSWLFSIYVVINNKQQTRWDEAGKYIEQITVFFRSITICMFIHFTLHNNTTEISTILIDHYGLWVESVILFICNLTQYFIQQFPDKKQTLMLIHISHPQSLFSGCITW